MSQSADLGVLVFEKGVEHLIAAIAQADEAEAHAVVGAVHARAGGRSMAAVVFRQNWRRVMRDMEASGFGLRADRLRATGYGLQARAYLSYPFRAGMIPGRSISGVYSPALAKGRFVCVAA